MTIPAYCFRMFSSSEENGFVPRKYAARFEIHCRAALCRKLGHSNPQHAIISNVCAKEAAPA
jgi:hypothetical protein